MKLSVSTLIAAAVALGLTTPGFSLGFEELQNGEQVLDFYAGGFGGLGSGPGPNFGISFTEGLAQDPEEIAFFGPSAVLTAPSVTMTLDQPTDLMLSFYFVGSGEVTFSSGPDATGTLLGSYGLQYPPFFPFAAQPGTFQSVVFSGQGLQIDSVTVADGSVIPESSTAGLLLSGIVSFAVLRACRRRREVLPS